MKAGTIEVDNNGADRKHASMTLDQCVDSLVALAESEKSDALQRMDSYTHAYVVANRVTRESVADLWDDLFKAFQRATSHLHSNLSTQMLEKIAEHIPFGQ